MSVDLIKSIGKAARRARNSLGLTQEDVAERLAITPQFYGRIERGHALPSVVTLVHMTEVLDISADALMGHNGVRRVRSAKPRAGPRTRLKTDSPELRRLVRYLRKASPATIDLVSVLMEELAIPGDEEGGT